MNAKEMFEELGYIQSIGERSIRYDRKNEFENRAIWFVIPEKTFIIGSYQYTTLKELKAINKQINELGWDNE